MRAYLKSYHMLTTNFFSDTAGGWIFFLLRLHEADYSDLDVCNFETFPYPIRRT
jgi:hypothetical protein